MNIVPTNLTVADLCQAMSESKLLINHKYQRSDQVWPSIARSFFIETILLGFPVPKLSLYQITDLKSRLTHREIVDGQQRSMALSDFYTDKLRLSTTLETEAVAGRRYSQLDDDYKQKFVEYSLSCDLFVGATDADIREVFRRINAYTVPLNPEEERHAVYQGKVKWFIHKLSRELEATLLQLDVFTEKQIVRMQDSKLLADVCYAFLHGLETTKRKQLDELYRSRDSEFPEARELESRIRGVFRKLFEWTDLHGGPLMKPHVVYSLILAVSHVMKPRAELQKYHRIATAKEVDLSKAIPNLTTLAEVVVMEEDSVPTKFRDFFLACDKKTNVRDNRVTRFAWLCRALTKSTL